MVRIRDFGELVDEGESYAQQCVDVVGDVPRDLVTSGERTHIVDAVLASIVVRHGRGHGFCHICCGRAWVARVHLGDGVHRGVHQAERFTKYVDALLQRDASGVFPCQAHGQRVGLVQGLLR